MKILIFLLLFVITFSLAAQKKRIFDTAFVNQSSNDFFVRNPEAIKINFEISFFNERSVCIYTKGYWADTTYTKATIGACEFYNFNFLGDVYHFEKKYGHLQFPQKEMAIAISRKCNPDPSLSISIKADTVTCLAELYCRWIRF